MIDMPPSSNPSTKFDTTFGFNESQDLFKSPETKFVSSAAKFKIMVPPLDMAKLSQSIPRLSL